MITLTTPRGTPVTLHVREGTNDQDVLRACLTEDEYGLAALRLTGTAIDIGAHIGGVTIALLVDNPELHVRAVEPLRENVELLLRNLWAAGVQDRCTIHVGAASDTDDMVPITWRHAGSDDARTHQFIGNQQMPAGTRHSVINSPAVLLASLLGDGRASFLKIDCEGCEWKVLADPAIDRVDRIHGEWHRRDDNDPDALRTLLDETHAVAFVVGDRAGAFEAVRR